jgi:hypothetical protein
MQIENCLNDKAWQRMRPLGMKLCVLKREPLEGELFENITFSATHKNANKSITLAITVPIFNENVIHWRNSQKALLYTGDVLADSDFDICMDHKEESERMDLHINTPYEVATRGMENAIASGLRNWFYDNDPQITSDIVQVFVDKWLASGSEWRVLKYSRIAREDQNNGIILNLFPEGISHNSRMMSRVFNPKLWAFIDLNSTSIGDKVNESFRFIEGTTSKNNKLIATNSDITTCKVLSRHAIGLGMNPRRTYLLRNTFEQAIDLVEPDKPLVTPYEDDEINHLHGKNLTTAVMHLEHFTHEDAIAISEDAAKSFIASRTITQLVESNLPVLPLVKEGEEVSHDIPIALDGEVQVTASKLHYPGIVKEISSSQGNRFGVRTNRCWLRYESYYPLVDGDKLSNRHGGKGVVTIIPNSRMPYYLDKEGKKVTIDICIGPETITNRKSISVLWEMMLAKKALSAGTPIKVDLYEKNTDEVSWSTREDQRFDVVAQKYGNKIQLWLGDNMLPSKTFVGSMFWLRLDKLSKEIVSCCTEKRTLNNFSAAIDDAKISGQRCNSAKLLAMCARNLETLAADIIDQNMSGKEHFVNLISAINNQRFLVKN